MARVFLSLTRHVHLSVPCSTTVASTFYAKDLTVKLVPEDDRKRKPVWSKLRFGRNYTDHMLAVEWDDQEGWHKPKIVQLQNLSLHPGAKVLHYATELFEGFKAYRGVDNKIRLFRPELNIKRMLRTAKRCALPVFDGDELLKSILRLVEAEREWVPYDSSSSLYIRPAMIGTDSILGIAESHHALLFVILCPVGAYYPTGFAPITLLADPQYVRAFPGGVGSFKMGCNYAPSIEIARNAQKQGCHQVLWLYGEKELVSEVGTMNIFWLWINDRGEKELVTPPLDAGVILPGITRQCVLELCREWGKFKVVERDTTLAEIFKAAREKRLLEMFGSGTACVVSPVDKIVYKNGSKTDEITIPTMQQKPSVMQELYDTLLDIQYGRKSKPDWTKIVVE